MLALNVFVFVGVTFMSSFATTNPEVGTEITLMDTLDLKQQQEKNCAHVSDKSSTMENSGTSSFTTEPTPATLPNEEQMLSFLQVKQRIVSMMYENLDKIVGDKMEEYTLPRDLKDKIRSRLLSMSGRLRHIAKEVFDLYEEDCPSMLTLWIPLFEFMMQMAALHDSAVKQKHDGKK